MATGRKVLVYGGKGALGSVCIQHFKAKNWSVGNVDLVVNEAADANVIVQAGASWTEQQERVVSGVEDWIKDGDKLDAVICVAGGWAGGNAASKDFVKNSDLMWKQSVWTSAISAHVAAKFLKDGGLLTLTGAKPALEGTPGMLGYGMAKAAVHQLVRGLGQEKGGLPAGATTLAILPVTLDTPMNRKFMPNADHSTWTPLETVAEYFSSWIDGQDRPTSGSLIQLITKEGNTERVPVNT